MLLVETNPSIVPRSVLLPLLGIAFSDVLPEPDSAPMPVVSSCISWMLPWSVM